MAEIMTFCIYSGTFFLVFLFFKVCGLEIALRQFIISFFSGLLLILFFFYGITFSRCGVLAIIAIIEYTIISVVSPKAILDSNFTVDASMLAACSFVSVYGPVISG